jgi:uncharacterized membrane protein YcaP (DUF421 family)
MQSWEIHLNDWVRILFGNVPPEFFIELIIRVTFIYLLVIVCIRLMGKRMATQLSRNELVAISSLAASIGIPIQTPDRGLLPALLVALIVVAGQRIVAYKLARSEPFERKSQGNIATLVNDCSLRLEAMRHSRISREEVFARLRSEQITHLGQVRRLYFEARGTFTIIRNEEQQPGLCVLPEDDPDFRQQQHYLTDQRVCADCGHPADDHSQTCPSCGHDKFVHPIS